MRKLVIALLAVALVSGPAFAETAGYPGAPATPAPAGGDALSQDGLTANGQDSNNNGGLTTGLLVGAGLIGGAIFIAFKALKKNNTPTTPVSP